MARRGWSLSVNPAYRERAPEALVPACHDRSPMIDVRCDCGDISHVHETQVVPETTMGVRCPSCHDVMIIPADVLLDGFAEMRQQGWIAQE